MISIFTFASLTTGLAQAKQGRDENRLEYYGIVEKRPQEGMQGEWTIGERVFITDNSTEFDETEGPLTEGSCAKVHIRNGRIHEIDSEPMQDCR